MPNKNKIKIWLIAILIAFSLNNYAQSPRMTPISNFKRDGIKNWRHKVFNGKTDYKIVKLNNKPVLFASSHGTASGLIKEQKIDLTKTPYLNWSWRIENRLGNLIEQSKSGDDCSQNLCCY